MTYHRVCSKINTTGATSGAGTVYPSGAPEFTTDFKWCSCYSIFRFMCMFCRSLFVLLPLFFWPLCCLFFFDVRILITSLISSNSSYRSSKHNRVNWWSFYKNIKSPANKRWHWFLLPQANGEMMAMADPWHAIVTIISAFVWQTWQFARKHQFLVRMWNLSSNRKLMCTIGNLILTIANYLFCKLKTKITLFYCVNYNF